MLQNFTEEKFKEWLFSLPDETIVGYAGEYCNCPIASYLKQLGYENMLVSNNVYWKDESLDFIPLPQWAKDVVKFVDWDCNDISNWLGEVRAKDLRRYYSSVDS